MLHRVDVTQGLLEDECRMMIQAFFQRRRVEQKEKRRGETSE
jgi:tRNA(adenine34) deaminase